MQLLRIQLHLNKSGTYDIITHARDDAGNILATASVDVAPADLGGTITSMEHDLAVFAANVSEEEKAKRRPAKPVVSG